jgi:hypothetical protein
MDAVERPKSKIRPGPYSTLLDATHRIRKVRLMTQRLFRTSSLR